MILYVGAVQFVKYININKLMVTQVDSTYGPYKLKSILYTILSWLLAYLWIK